MAEIDLYTGEDVWVDVTDLVAQACGIEEVTVEQVRSWSLVLMSQEVPHRVEYSPPLVHIWVPTDRQAFAVEQLCAYESENENWVISVLEPVGFENAATTAVIALCLAAFHTLTGFYISGFGHDPIRWFEFGNAYAGRMVEGEWWRSVTALTLHADALHITSNLVFGGFFITWLCRDLGSGLGWFLVLWSGIMGNVINAMAQSPFHQAVGASTAVFGAIGILAGLRMVEHNRYSIKDRMIPFAAGLMLLGLLGSGGERTDLGAHLFGLLCGIGLGAGIGLWLKIHDLPDIVSQRILGVIAILIPIIAWALALSV